MLTTLSKLYNSKDTTLQRLAEDIKKLQPHNLTLLRLMPVGNKNMQSILNQINITLKY